MSARHDEMLSPGWSADREQMLRKLWDQDLSVTVIAAAMQITRNAVIGKAHRLGLRQRDNPVKRSSPSAPRLSRDELKRRNAERQRGRREAARSPRAPASEPPGDAKQADKPDTMHKRGIVFISGPKPTIPLIEEAETEKAGKFTLVEVLDARTCKWPSGHVPGMTFCGRKRDPNDPNNNYCTKHLLRSIRLVHRAEAAE